MAVLTISKIYWNILVLELFLHHLYVIILNVYLNNDELFGIRLPLTFKSTSPSISSLLNCHKFSEVSE